jgi:hypothetical protein
MEPMQEKFSKEKSGVMVCPAYNGYDRIRHPDDVKVCQKGGIFGFIKDDGKTFDQKEKPISTTFL